MAIKLKDVLAKLPADERAEVEASMVEARTKPIHFAGASPEFSGNLGLQ